MADRSRGRVLKAVCCGLALVVIITGSVLIESLVYDQEENLDQKGERNFNRSEEDSFNRISVEQIDDIIVHSNSTNCTAVEDCLPLKEGSTSYKNWVSPLAPTFFQVWVQNVANPMEVVKTGAKPVLVQMGPYTYRVKREKVNVTFTGGDKTVAYREKQWYHFDRSLSVGPESDKFTTVNMPMLTIAYMMRFEPAFVRQLINLILEETNEHLFIDLTVEDLLWGYEDKFLKEVKEVLAKMGIKLPIDDKFGLFLNKNGSDDGVYTIDTGLKGTLDQLAEITSWNGNRTLSFWNSATANSLNGSDGTLYPPCVNKSKSLYFFFSDFCRSLEIWYSQTYSLKEMDVDRFVVPAMDLANVSVNPDNIGFCTPYTNCLPAGLLNVSVCRDGAPVILSLPHFLDADPDVRDRVIGMHPNRTEHQTFIDIEPMSGVAMKWAKRLQINAYLTNIPQIKDLEHLHGYIVLPLLWTNESATIDDKSAADLKREVVTPMKADQCCTTGGVLPSLYYH